MNVNVVTYSSEWKIWFKNLSCNLSDALRDVSCRIEHVGSTSVEGLDSKPIIDIDIILEDFDGFEPAKKTLEGIGYCHRGNLGLEGREMFEISNPIHPHNLYVCDPHALAVKNHLVFREHLRSHPGIAKKYARLKHELAEKYPHDVDTYCEAKTEFISSILSQCDFSLTEIYAIKKANKVE
ncbi:GrpB family protein [Desulfoluna spongiiphila]|uniref:GrpB domain, predicted nucleotidyltransferase, UPF0157 family n=1 Tax=Desulfoluna spongiiphila TaxID=419481 RepID=A0A1G5DFE2_9BACT|nr:GrpB family protein [Desulfoluna spongiiphila]SCY13589.1 GrpB domain, predicted nucleotidyltransferase, UPF0157 family [Desulfoluna spongiiphila]